MKRFLLFSFFALISFFVSAQDEVKTDFPILGTFYFRGYMSPNEIAFKIKNNRDSVIYFVVHPLRTNIPIEKAMWLIDPEYRRLMLLQGRKMCEQRVVKLK